MNSCGLNSSSILPVVWRREFQLSTVHLFLQIRKALKTFSMKTDLDNGFVQMRLSWNFSTKTTKYGHRFSHANKSSTMGIQRHMAIKAARHMMKLWQVLMIGSTLFMQGKSANLCSLQLTNQTPNSITLYSIAISIHCKVMLCWGSLSTSTRIAMKCTMISFSRRAQIH